MNPHDMLSMKNYATPSLYAKLSLNSRGQETLELLEICRWKDRCQNACLNTPKFTVVGGKTKDVAEFKSDLA